MNKAEVRTRIESEGIGNIIFNALPQNATNSQTFINVFGIDAWKQMIEFSNLNEQFREFWNAPYKADKEGDSDAGSD